MLLVNVMRYFNGIVYFNARGGFVERLLNLCANNNISIFKIKKTDDGITAATRAIDYKSLKKLAKKANVEVLITRKYGFPFRANKYTKRFGLYLGIFLLITIIYISQSFVWNITINGNKKISDELILKRLESIGIKRGSFISSIDVRKKQLEAMLCIDELAWIALNISGGHIEVNLSERIIAPVILEQEPCDIVALKTGQIRYMEVYEGQSLLKSGYTVSQGDVIVSGEVIAKDKVSYVHSRARIIAEVSERKTIVADLNEISKEYNNNVKNRYYIDILGLKLPLFIATKMKGEYDISQNSIPITIFGTKLPIQIYKKEYKQYIKKSNELSKEQARQNIMDSFQQYEQVELVNSLILNKNINEYEQDNKLYIEIEYTIETDIASKALVKSRIDTILR